MFRIQRLFIEEAARDDPVTRQVRQRLAHLPAEIIPAKEALRLPSPLTPDDITQGQRNAVAGPAERAILAVLSRHQGIHLLRLSDPPGHDQLPYGLQLLCPSGLFQFSGHYGFYELG